MKYVTLFEAIIPSSRHHPEMIISPFIFMAFSPMHEFSDSVSKGSKMVELRSEWNDLLNKGHTKSQISRIYNFSRAYVTRVMKES